MPIGLGLASSHAPNMFVPPDKWERRYQQRTKGKPRPLEVEAETQQVIESYVQRIEDGFLKLSERLSAYRPDLLIMVSDDQGEVFDERSCSPTIALFCGKEASGTKGLHFLGPDFPDPPIHLKGNPELGEYLAQGLVDEGFDITCVRELRPIGNPQRGLSHGFTRTAPKLMPALDIPVLLVFLNCYYPPLPSAKRCIELGGAISRLFSSRPERVAIYGSGGLSHDVTGPRAGWIDQALDKSVLAAFAAGNPEKLAGLYTVDSDTLRSGTGEIRNWIVAAAAMGNNKATVVDYIPAYHAITGLGFAYWAAEMSA